jgi:D-serine deaminase-like pyridoxal phosphate-dependent protein
MTTDTADRLIALKALPTPSLLLDEARMERNIERLASRTAGLGSALRPHLKTVKSVDVARRVLEGAVGATVSTLREAEEFFAAGVNDIVYAVGIAPGKLDRVIDLRKAGCDLVILLDSREQADAVGAASLDAGTAIPALIEIDCDGHRGGLRPGDGEIVEVARCLVEGGGALRGVLTHAGESYSAYGVDAQADCAEQERLAVVMAAAALEKAGFDCAVVSMGSTPTAHAVRDLGGVTEVRAGVYVFFDLVQAGIGVCTPDDIALSVLTAVIGHGEHHGAAVAMIDAGWMALSRDRGTANQRVDQGYGVVCNIDGRIYPELIVSETNQEHGMISVRPGSSGALPDLALGTRLRILPNHACATAAQFRFYNMLPADPGAPLTRWERFSGW